VIGKVFNRLTVLKFSHSDGNKHWYCKCSCGNYTTVKTCDLNSGHTKSCGCLQKTHARLIAGQAAFNTVYRRYKKESPSRGLAFELSKEEFKELTSQNCHYCNKTPDREFTDTGKAFGSFIYNGIDRVDNNIGYILFNCVPCCTYCNYAKHNRKQEDFINWIGQLVKFHNDTRRKEEESRNI
jgi:hypothetical protein